MSVPNVSVHAVGFRRVICIQLKALLRNSILGQLTVSVAVLGQQQTFAINLDENEAA